MLEAVAQKTGAVRRIRGLIMDVLRGSPDGIQVRDLKARILEADSTLNASTIATVISDFATESPHIRRLARGLLALAEIGNTVSSDAPEVLTEFTQDQRAEAAREANFYQPFSDWLVNEAGEATEAVALGGAGLRVKWGTPDVIGIYKPRPSDLIKFPIEIVSVEIKLDVSAAITAFGQAISYRLFSHKTIVAISDVIEKTEDVNSRLKSLCHLFGVGYVLFDKDRPDTPNFRLLIPPRRFDPDMDYVNEFATRLLDINRGHFDKLFR